MKVALVGFMRSGKSSVAEALAALYPPVRNISFAAALKAEAAQLLNSTRPLGQPPFTAEFFNADENRPLYRPLLQWYGTEYRRGQDKDYWVRKVAVEIEALEALDTFNLTCTDGRFLNELDMLKARGFDIVLLDMNVDEVADYLSERGLTRPQIQQQLSHPSELEWQSFKPDFRVQSTFGNLPRITTEIAAYLTGEKPDRQAIEEFYRKRYPGTYK